MSDAEMIARMLDGGVLAGRMIADRIEALRAALTAANARIEALTKEREKDHANINLKADFIDKTLNQLAEADAKLAKAVEALRTTTQILSKCLFETILVKGQYLDRKEVVAFARTTLAEIEGEKG